MIKIIFYILLIFAAVECTAQMLPKNHFLADELTSLKIAEDNKPASNSISDILIAGNNIWLGTSCGVSLSTDNGSTWTNFFGTEIFGSESISAIAYDSLTNTFWAGTAHSIRKDDQDLPEGSGLRYTTDNGVSWTSIPQPLDNNGDTIVQYGSNNIRALPVTVAVQNLVYDIAITPGTVWIATFAGGLRKSTDNGQTWMRVVIPPDDLNSVRPEDTLDFCLQPVGGRFCTDNNLNHRVFSVIAADDSTLYVGTAGGINKSTDGGSSWVKYNRTNQDYPISGNFVVALGYQKFNNTVWAATWKAEGETEFYGISSSENNGETWSIFLEDERVHNFGFGGVNAAAPSDNGLFRTTNKGVTWIKPNTITDNSTGISLLTTVFYSAAFKDNDVWLGSAEGLAKITETGMWIGNWKLFIASQPVTETYAFPNPFNPRTDLLKIKYAVPSPDRITIRVYDFGMNYVRTIIQNAERNPLHLIDGDGAMDYWDGRDDSGKMVPNGVYFYRVERGDDRSFYGKILVLQ